ncbi:hypothetical protein IWX63_001757 [Arthrobacter sp. CAN_A2]|uniref:hypothetical protein n=1 Tax=Arthrobacter sp. CAN_A2 TaxID=2787718 RepID=UPI0018EFDACF
MSENPDDTPTADPDEQGADQAGKPEEQDAGGYGGPGTEEEVAPGFEAHNGGETGA